MMGSRAFVMGTVVSASIAWYALCPIRAKISFLTGHYVKRPLCRFQDRKNKQIIRERMDEQVKAHNEAVERIRAAKKGGQPMSDREIEQMLAEQKARK